MRAVLSRTHLPHELNSLLMPIMEAVSNAMYGIEEKYGDKAASEGEISIVFKNPNEPSKTEISITDNGVGLTEENYKSFQTPFSGYRLDKKGRGFGRFIAFKIFSRILYSSRYEFMSSKDVRCFRFDINGDDEFIYFDGEPDFEHTGVRVEYDSPLKPWHEFFREINIEGVRDSIANNFLPYFLYQWLPKITIQFGDGKPEDIREHFQGIFIEFDKGTIEVSIDGFNETLNYSLTKIPKTKSYKNHCLLFSAANRIVGNPRDLTNLLGQPHFTDEENKKYIVLAVVSGEAFDRRLESVRKLYE